MNSLKLFSFLLLLVAVNARPHEEHAPRPYKFSYGVSDHHTGDHHQHHEESDGHIVRGSYSLKEPDGTIRIVDYYAGPHTGFHAVVRRIGHPDPVQHYQVFGEHEHEEGRGEEQGGVEQGGEEIGGGEEQGGEIEEYGGQGEIGGEGQGGYGGEQEEYQEHYQEQGGQEQAGVEQGAQSYAGASQWGYEQ